MLKKGDIVRGVVKEIGEEKFHLLLPDGSMVEAEFADSPLETLWNPLLFIGKEVPARVLSETEPRLVQIENAPELRKIAESQKKNELNPNWLSNSSRILDIQERGGRKKKIRTLLGEIREAFAKKDEEKLKEACEELEKLM